MSDNGTEVTAAGIARLAGVGRAAVSNWRRRHADFPKPVGGTDTHPSYALAEIEAWLRGQGKLAEVPLEERVWQQLAGHPQGAATALVHIGCVLLLLHDRHPLWLEASAGSDERLAGLLPGALEQVLAPRFGPARPPALTAATAEALLPSVPLLRGAAELAAESGARQTFEFLLGRLLDTGARPYTPTPDGLATLMAHLAGPARTVLDPACGTGALLRAAASPPGREPDGQELSGQDGAPEAAALTALRLALHTRATLRTAAGDSLRADAYDTLRADAVLCHPPFNERNWGHDELAYDPRWEYGLPARTESELAWVQHALARLKDDGTAVLLMPPAAAGRRSGRRIRADLLRRGALRAVIALPAGAAPPHSVPLHLWVLRRPGRTPAPLELLLVDAGRLADGAAAPPRRGRETSGSGRGGIDWPAVHTAVTDAWRAFDRTGTAAGEPGLSRSLPVVDLLDDDVDLTPARHLPPPAADGDTEELSAVRERLGETLRLTADLAPPAPADRADGTGSPDRAARWPLTTVGELARAGALSLRTGGHGAHARVLTDHDVLAGTAPSGSLPDTGDAPVLVAVGDVVVPVLGGGGAARVVDEATAGAALGRNLALLRPDPVALDPYFLAGFLRSTANSRRASSHTSTATRLDVRRLQLPRLPLDQQRRYGTRFRALAEFEDALRLAGRLGERLVRGMHDGLTDGTVAPD